MRAIAQASTAAVLAAAKGAGAVRLGGAAGDGDREGLPADERTRRERHRSVGGR
ncbi:hypothetical protein [Streptomyces sp. NPDC001137]|uniref:hypothetical protein n=1 Tax=Streptomyces sp. NPDC001137 TaxID=3154378 RepID=UPI00332FF9E7